MSRNFAEALFPKRTSRLALSGDLSGQHDPGKQHSIHRLLADYKVNAYVDVYGQLAYLTNGDGAAESFHSLGSATCLGPGYANQSQFVASTGVRLRF